MKYTLGLVVAKYEGDHNTKPGDIIVKLGS
jgi:hypothetical protein